MTISSIFSPRPDPQGTGLWGVPTSSVNWCEEDYTVSYYIAEFFNSFSSLCMVAFGLIGQYSLRRLSPIANASRTQTRAGHPQPPSATDVYDPLLAHPALLGINRVWYTWFALQIVGWGSVAFHGSLQWWSQAFDEVPMVWTAIVHLTTCLVGQYEPFPLATAITTAASGSNNASSYTRPLAWLKRNIIPSLRRSKSGWYTPVMSPALLLHALTCSLLVTIFRGPSQFLVFHVLFGSAELAGFYCTYQMYKNSGRQSADEILGYCKSEYSEAEHKRLVSRHREDMSKLHHRGTWTYIFAVFIWSIDLNFCDYVSKIPVSYPDLAGYLAGGVGELQWVSTTVNPQGHAWWHLLVSVGFYQIGILATYNRVLAGYRGFWEGVERGEEGCLELLKEDKVRGRKVVGKGDVPVVEWLWGVLPVVDIRRQLVS